MNLNESLQLVERKLHMWPGVKADVVVILHEMWKPDDREWAQGITFQVCECHDWTTSTMIRYEPV